MSFWTKEKEAELRRLWPTIMTVEAIAIQLGTTESAVTSRRMALNLPPRFLNRASRTARTGQELAALKTRCIELNAEGKSRKQIAAELRISTSTIMKFLGQVEHGHEDAKFDPAIMEYEEFQRRWEYMAGPKDTHLFDDAIVSAPRGRAPFWGTHVPRCA